jgi:hypothetical protein
LSAESEWLDFYRRAGKRAIHLLYDFAVDERWAINRLSGVDFTSLMVSRGLHHRVPIGQFEKSIQLANVGNTDVAGVHNENDLDMLNRLSVDQEHVEFLFKQSPPPHNTFRLPPSSMILTCLVEIPLNVKPSRLLF